MSLCSARKWAVESQCKFPIINQRTPFGTVVYTIMYIQMSFGWDDNKNRANRVKHGIDFDFARLAFDDPFAITTQDRDVEGEQRYQLIGAVFTRIILVAHAVRTKSIGWDQPKRCR